MKKIITIFSLALVFACAGIAQSTPPSSGIVLQVVKAASVELNVSPDVLWNEYQSGDASVTLLDQKTGTYALVAGGGNNGTTVIVESIF